MEPLSFLQHIDPTLPENQKQETLQQLTHYINELIQTDFSQLVQLLYTVDVDEQKLKRLLQQHPTTDAAPLIAQLVWNRVAEKARSRQQFSASPPTDDAERW